MKYPPYSSILANMCMEGFYSFAYRMRLNDLIAYRAFFDLVLNDPYLNVLFSTCRDRAFDGTMSIFSYILIEQLRLNNRLSSLIVYDDIMFNMLVLIN